MLSEKLKSYRRLRPAGLLVGAALLLSACGVVPQAAPFDPVIDETVSGFDKSFQTFAIDLAKKAGTPAGQHAAHTQFYTKWGGELAHLKNRAIATDPADSCPLSGQVAEVFQVIAQTTGGFGVSALGESDDILALAGAAIAKVEIKLDELSAKLNQPAGTLTPSQIDTVKAEIGEWEGKKTRLQNVLSAMSTTEVAPPEGGCSTIVVAKLAEQFAMFEKFHQAQGAIGIPARARAPVILMNVTIQNVLKVQAVKRQKTVAGQL